MGDGTSGLTSIKVLVRGWLGYINGTNYRTSNSIPVPMLEQTEKALHPKLMIYYNILKDAAPLHLPKPS
jgi:hypothetical protein